MKMKWAYRDDVNYMENGREQCIVFQCPCRGNTCSLIRGELTLLFTVNPADGYIQSISCSFQAFFPQIAFCWSALIASNCFSSSPLESLVHNFNPAALINFRFQNNLYFKKSWKSQNNSSEFNLIFPTNGISSAESTSIAFLKNWIIFHSLLFLIRNV